MQAIALDPKATPEGLAELTGVEMHDLCLRMAFFELAGLIENCSGPLRFEHGQARCSPSIPIQGETHDFLGSSLTPLAKIKPST